jgi:hypothetical protein
VVGGAAQLPALDLRIEFGGGVVLHLVLKSSNSTNGSINSASACFVC